MSRHVTTEPEYDDDAGILNSPTNTYLVPDCLAEVCLLYFASEHTVSSSAEATVFEETGEGTGVYEVIIRYAQNQQTDLREYSMLCVLQGKRRYYMERDHSNNATHTHPPEMKSLITMEADS